MHFIFQPLIGIKDAFAMFQKQFPGFCERNFIPLPIEKPRLITSFQFLDMFCYGRLTYKKLLRGFSETEILRYTLKYFQTKIDILSSD